MLSIFKKIIQTFFGTDDLSTYSDQLLVWTLQHLKLNNDYREIEVQLEINKRVENKKWAPNFDTEIGMILMNHPGPKLKTANMKFGDQDLFLVRDLAELNVIDLSGTLITDESVLFIGDQCTKLLAIDFSGTQITDLGFTKLQLAGELRELYINDTAITDKGLFKLTGLKALRYISAVGSTITWLGTEKFLPKHKDLWGFSEIEIDYGQ
ncbi:MAG: hypothetical protein IPM97_05230 [Bdellovibrionaceae bacterium]|nr:hypothetical protein [Pseudobdellovibrionaceae bacterium]